MQRSINIFSSILLNLFNLISKSSCMGVYGEPDYPEELLK
ncbi:cyclic lactone autoinducer peptide [Clostridium beijerinckii]|nr:cyclic lactone autoinducer peptide [Clostridium beijerinckii]